VTAAPGGACPSSPARRSCGPAISSLWSYERYPGHSRRAHDPPRTERAGHDRARSRLEEHHQPGAAPGGTRQRTVRLARNPGRRRHTGLRGRSAQPRRPGRHGRRRSLAHRRRRRALPCRRGRCLLRRSRHGGALPARGRGRRRRRLPFRRGAAAATAPHGDSARGAPRAGRRHGAARRRRAAAHPAGSRPRRRQAAAARRHLEPVHLGAAPGGAAGAGAAGADRRRPREPPLRRHDPRDDGAVRGGGRWVRARALPRGPGSLRRPRLRRGARRFDGLILLRRRRRHRRPCQSPRAATRGVPAG